MTTDRVEVPRVSVVVPSYRAGAYQGELCAALARQTWTDIEVLILSDGCDDHLHPAVQAQARDPRFRVASWSPNQGVARATAHLLQQARGTYWCYPGADDLLDPGFLAARLEVMAAEPEVDVIFGAGRHIDQRGAPTVYGPAQVVTDRLAAWDGRNIEPARMLAVLLQENVVNTPSVLCRSERTIPLILQADVPWRYAQDLHYWLRLAAAGRIFRYDARVLHSYRIHPAQMSAALELDSVRRAELRLVSLVALGESAGLTPAAQAGWTAWRDELYALWVLRALRLLKGRQLRPEWREAAARAYHGPGYRPLRAWIDLIWRLPGALRLHRAEQRRAASQIYVNGLRQIDDPLFRLERES